jgi:hypothetical protein
LRPLNATNLYQFTSYLTTATNTGNARTISIPSWARRVLLEAIVTGHGSDPSTGCCEFLPTLHKFTVNGVTFNLSFNQAGSNWGCSDQALQGSEPNEYGTWWYGRAGWCNGMDVRPWVVDVSAAALPSSSSPSSSAGVAQVDYQALLMDAQGEWVAPPATQSGYVIVSSNLVFYEEVEEEEEPPTDVVEVVKEFVQSVGMAVRTVAIALSVISLVVLVCCVLVVYLYHSNKGEAEGPTTSLHSPNHSDHGLMNGQVSPGNLSPVRREEEAAVEMGLRAPPEDRGPLVEIGLRTPRHRHVKLPTVADEDAAKQANPMHSSSSRTAKLNPVEGLTVKT